MAPVCWFYFLSRCAACKTVRLRLTNRKLFVKSLSKNFTFFFLRHTRAAQKGGFPFAGRTSQAKAAAGASTRPYHSFSNLAKLANSFFVPTFSKAISSNVSLAIGVAESTIPWPKVLCFTVSPAR